MTRPGRIPCCVPFCRRTTAQEKIPGATETICYQHWRLAPQKRRRVYSRAWRAWKRAVAREVSPGSYASLADLKQATRAAHRADRLWNAMKREIITAAAGI